MMVQNNPEWMNKLPLASHLFSKMAKEKFNGLVRNVTFQHVDESGYYYSYQLLNDNTVYTYVVRHSDLK